MVNTDFVVDSNIQEVDEYLDDRLGWINVVESW